MTKVLDRLTDDEVSQSSPAGDEAGCGALATTRGRLPLRAMDLRGRIDGLLCQMTLSQTFVNAFSEALEATYIFPLPDRAAVTHFRMEVNGRVIEGQLKERGQARREYSEAIEKGHRAAITEEERPGVFTLRVGNIMPGEEASIRLTLAGPLPYSNGEATFRFPLVVATRYIPGVPLPGDNVGAGTATDTTAVPDASRISPPVLLPGFPNPVRLSINVDVMPSGLSVGDIRSSLHAVEETTTGRVRRITLHPGARLDRDFILRLRMAEDQLRTTLLLQPDGPGVREGTFLLTLVPPVGQAATQPRDVVFVLDRSGSMGGWKMVAARRALGRMVDTLLDHDRFTVLAFDDHIETPPSFNGLAHAVDRQRFRAIEFLAKVDSRGGTEMAQPLEQAVTLLASAGPGRDRVLVLITDGQVGNEDQILHDLGPRLRGIRVFCLGIDQAVNAAFLRRLADLGGGACELVESEDRLDEVMEQVHRRIGQPVLTRLRLEPAGLRFDPASLVPDRMPDVFAGSPVQVLGRYSGQSEGALVLGGTDATGKSWQTTIAATMSDSPSLGAVCARGQVRKLEDRYAIERAEELEKRIVATSLRFGVLSRFTAFVAVDRSAVVNAGGEGQEITQPVEMPAGWEAQNAMPQVFACLAAPAPTGAASTVKAYHSIARGGSPQKRAKSASSKPPVPASPPDSLDDEAVNRALFGDIFEDTDLPSESCEVDIAKFDSEAGPPSSESEIESVDSYLSECTDSGVDSTEPDFDDEDNPDDEDDDLEDITLEDEGMAETEEAPLAQPKDAAARRLPPDIERFKKRARKMVADLQASTGADLAQRRLVLARIRKRVEKMLQELKQDGIVVAEMNRLQALLPQLLGDLSNDIVMLQLWGELEEALIAFAGSSQPPNEKFWA